VKPWRILHVDLLKPIPALALEKDKEGVYVYFWCQALLLGRKVLASSELPLSSHSLFDEAIRSVLPALTNYWGVNAGSACVDFNLLSQLDRPLERLSERSAPDDTSLSISVIICTRDRPVHLRECLKSLEQLSDRPDEILVVDNAPRTSETREVVGEFPGLRYVFEPRPGLDLARNTGLRQSSGEIVAFTDDDAVVHPDWLKRLRQGFAEPSVWAVTGPALPAALATEAQLAFETFWSFDRGYQAVLFTPEFAHQTRSTGSPAWIIGAGANMAFRRQAFLFDAFDERLDVGAAGCAGDSELWYNLLSRGKSCRYEPSAVVFHSHRSDWKSLESQIFHYMRGHVAALLIQFEKHRHWGNLRRLFISLPWSWARLFLSGCMRGFSLRHRFLRQELAGSLAGVWYYLLQPRPLSSARTEKGVRRGPKLPELINYK
jgi:glycosyltransferase involved in cell wall biosynthesis